VTGDPAGDGAIVATASSPAPKPPGGVDWDEVAELLPESYCVLAPKKLAALVSRPTPPAWSG
jgi:hypothetical protein